MDALEAWQTAQFPGDAQKEATEEGGLEALQEITEPDPIITGVLASAGDSHDLVCPDADSIFAPPGCDLPQCHPGMSIAGVTFLESVSRPKVFKTVTLESALGEIRSDKYEDRVSRLRGMDKAAYDVEKRKLSVFAFNGAFTGKIENDGFNQSSGLFHFDIDKLSPEDLDRIKGQLRALPSCVFIFTSPSGKGLKGALRIYPETVKNDADFKALFAVGEAYFKELDIVIDSSCKNVSRLCFVSHDPDLYINWHADLFDWRSMVPAKTTATSPVEVFSLEGYAAVSSDIQDECLRRITNLLEGAPEGDRHNSRLKAGRLAGGYIAGGLIDEAFIWSHLIKWSDEISESGTTSKSERTTLKEAIEHGKAAPIPEYCLTEPAELVGLLGSLAMVKLGGKSAVLMLDGADTIDTMTVSGARDYFANIKIKKGNEKTIQAFEEWRTHGSRATFKGIEFAPGKKGREGYFNMWRGFQVEPREGDCSLYLDHLKDVVCSGNEEHYQWLIGYFAHMVQRPDEKPGTAVVLRGKEGCGKGTVIAPLKNILGKALCNVTRTEQLVGKFNKHLAGAMLIFADEALWGGDKASEGSLKALVSEGSLRIEPKGLDSFEIPSYCRIVMSTNEDWAVPASVDARRWFVLDVPETRKEDHVYFKAIVDQLESGGNAALLHFLSTLDISKCNPRKAPTTAGLLDLKMLSMKPHEKWFLEVLSTGVINTGLGEFGPMDGGTKVLVDEVHNSYLTFAKRQGNTHPLDKWTFGKKLKEMCHEVDRTRLRQEGDRDYFYVFPPLADCRKLFDAYVKQPVEWDDVYPGLLA